MTALALHGIGPAGMWQPEDAPPHLRIAAGALLGIGFS